MNYRDPHEECQECGFFPDYCTCTITTVAQLQRAYEAAGRPHMTVNMVGGRMAASFIVALPTAPRGPHYGVSASLAEALTEAFKAFWDSKG